ncbi:MAG: PAS domain-containing protein, partial [Deinococcota bacterium]
ITSTIQRGTASVAWVDVTIVAETALWQQLQTRQGEFIDIEADLICGEVTGSELLVLHVVRPLSTGAQPQQRPVNTPTTPLTEARTEPISATTVETTMQTWLHNAPDVLETILPDSVAILDRDGIYHDIKDAAHYIPFTTVAESIGKTIEEALPNPLASHLRAALTHVFASQERQYVRSRLPVNGTVRHYETRLHYVDESICVSATHDITLQVRLEERAQRSDAKTRALVEAIPDSVVILSREGIYQEIHLPSNFKFVFHNENWEGKSIYEVPLAPNVAELLKHHMALLFKTQVPQRYTYDINIEDNARRREVTLTWIDEDHCLMLVRDLTAAIDLGTRLSKAIEALGTAPPLTEATESQQVVDTSVSTSIEILPDVTVRMDRQGMYTQILVPEGATLLTDLTADELIGKTFEEATPPELLDSARKCFEDAFLTGNIQTFSYELTYQDQVYHREARLIPINDNEIISVVRDFSEQYAAQRTLEQRERHLKTLIDALPDGIAIFDRAATYLEVSLSQYDTNVPTSALNLIGKTVYDILPKATAKRVHDCLERALDSGSLQVCTYEIEQDGQTYSREVRIVRLTATTALSVLRDITRRETTQRQLEQRERHLQTLLNTLPDAIIQISTDGYISELQIGSDFEIIAKSPLLDGKRLDQVLPSASVIDIHSHIRKAIDTGDLQLRYYHVRHQGETFYREMRIMQFNDDSVLAVTRDISEQRRSQLALEQSEQQLRAILQAFPDVIARFNPQGIYVETVHKGQLSSVFTFDTCVGKSFVDLMPADVASELQSKLEATFEQQRGHTYDYILEEDHKRYYREIRFIYLNDESCLGIIRDTTEWREMTGALETSLKHSEALLKEVHHRVRNNLQVLSSILHLHAASLKEPLAKQALNDNRRRIQTMAAVHRVLYENESYADIALDKYLQSTLRLFSQELAAWKIDLQLNIRAVQVSLDQAIPFGLIVSELLSNAARHAFPVGAVDKPKIEVSLYQQKNHVVFQVEDNGVGLPNNFDTLCQQNLGISIASSLTQQLDGKMTVDSANSPEVGSIARLEFPLVQD